MQTQRNRKLIVLHVLTYLLREDISPTLQTKCKVSRPTMSIRIYYDNNVSMPGSFPHGSISCLNIYMINFLTICIHNQKMADTGEPST